ncbi:uncharacterized protein F5147DRAFT_44515 [Suillus discolor]|uniref:Uncharacterized protein n=1 Tax=Suillus discolor TaxID=1912936 RepID=A0A9P7ET33_9AGAM|nr:uncharacterized protein F5147DRAFT_44515 [Suillus discolor]KAG2088669.1 hypothetical protein F5147DRAFT_44515 [Suillus discolor]
MPQGTQLCTCQHWARLRDQSCQQLLSRLLNERTAFAKSIPNFSDLITKLEREPESLTSFLKSMDSAANAARCDDTGSLKHTGLQYMLDDPAKDRFDPPILKSRSKALRGCNHPQTARLLGPARDIAEFDIDPQAYMDKVNAGEKKINAKQWPSMFYDMSLYDPKNKKKGLLGSRTLNQSNTGNPQNDAPPTPPRSSPGPAPPRSSPAPVS